MTLYQDSNSPLPANDGRLLSTTIIALSVVFAVAQFRSAADDDVVQPVPAARALVSEGATSDKGNVPLIEETISHAESTLGKNARRSFSLEDSQLNFRLPSQVSLDPINYLGIAKRARFLIVGDRFANEVGLECEQDADNLVRTLRTVLTDHLGGVLEGQQLDQIFTIDRIGSKRPIKPMDVLRYYQKLSGVDQESLIFIYSGHGGMTAQGEHYLAMSGGDLYRRELRSAMLSNSPRQVIILTSSCSNLPTALLQKTRPYSLENVRFNLVKDLFFRGLGVVDINASSPGQFAWTNGSGTIFGACVGDQLFAPSSALDANLDGTVNWTEFFAVIRQETARKYESLRTARIAVKSASPEMLQSVTQTPYAYSMPINHRISDKWMLIDARYDEKSNPSSGRGMSFALWLASYEPAGRKVGLHLYFRRPDGTYLRDYNGKYATPKGTIVVGSTVRMSLTGMHFRSQLFIPYSELHLARHIDYPVDVVLSISDMDVDPPSALGTAVLGKMTLRDSR